MWGFVPGAATSCTFVITERLPGNQTSRRQLQRDKQPISHLMVCRLLLHASHVVKIAFSDDKECSQSQGSFISANHVDVALFLRHLEPWPFPFPASYILSACHYYHTLSLILPVSTHAVQNNITCGVVWLALSCRKGGVHGLRFGGLHPPSASVFYVSSTLFPLLFLSPFELPCQTEEEKTPKTCINLISTTKKRANRGHWGFRLSILQNPLLILRV